MVENMNGFEPAAVRTIIRFNEALNSQDVNGMLSLMTEDCVFENTDPPPDGKRYEGKTCVRAFWEGFFRSSVQPHIEIEEIFATGDRCVMRWIYRWQDGQGNPGHIRGVDIYKLRGEFISEKLSYVKG